MKDNGMKMNAYFYKIWVPLQIMTVLAFIGVFTNTIAVNWWVVGIVWFLIGPVGNGLGLHRFFAHRQFETWRPVEVALAWLGTYGSYAPILFWAGIHQQHHRTSDTPEDLSSPEHHGFMESFFWYRLRERALRSCHLNNYCVKRIIRDKFLMWMSQHFVKIVWCIILFWAAVDLLGLFSVSMLVSAYIIPVFMEQTRSNIISSFSHMKIPGAYRPFETNDNTNNHIVIGFLSMGFGWHNAHHYNARELINTHRWWEIDVEGLIGKLLSKKTWQ